MIKRSKKGVSIASLSTSNESTTDSKDKFRDIWSFIKQVWYVPFIWSLAWFSYWIFQETILLGQPITQGNSLNFLGAAISIGALFIKGWISGKSSKKTLESVGKIEIEEKNSFKVSKVAGVEASQKSINFGSEYSETQLEHYPQIETNQNQEPSETPMELSQSAVTTEKIPSEINKLSQNKKQEIPSDCLICPNLTNCDQRQKRSAESVTSCPLLHKNAKTRN